jgi:hypothetical protein
LGAQAVKLVGALTGWIGKLLPEAVKGIGAFIAELAPKIPGLFFKLIAAMVNIGGRLGGDLITALVDKLKGIGQFWFRCWQGHLLTASLDLLTAT